MRPCLLAVALILTTAVTAAPVPKSVKKDDKSALVGTWKVSAVTINLKNSNLDTHTFIFDAEGGVKTLFGNNGTPDWTWTIDTTTSPRTMKWESKPGTKNSWNCVYELDGDSLKVGFLNKGTKPPAKLEPIEGLTLYVMTRDTTAK